MMTSTREQVWSVESEGVARSRAQVREAGPANVLLGDVHRLPEHLDRMIGVAARNP